MRWHWLMRVRLLWREEGQDLAEYALLVALIAVVVLAAISTFGTALQGYWQQIVDALAAIGG